MRVGVMTDVHANLPALRAALAAMKAEGCELIIHTGDAIGIGPHPREVMTLLREQTSMLMIMGNHDELFANGIPKPVPSWMGEGEVAHQLWTHEQLDDSWREWVRGWPYIIDQKFGSVSVRFQHYAMNQTGYAPISKLNQPTELDKAFEPTTDIVFYGHHHPQADVVGRARYINPGALGCHTRLGARFAVLEFGENRLPTVELRSVPYDAGTVYSDMISRNVPEAEFLLKTFMN